MRQLWARLGCLVAVLVLAAPSLATAAPAHRVIAIGDLHGDFAAWRDIIRAAGLVDDEGSWIGEEATLVQTGDVVDRGPDSLKILDDLMRLQREAQRADGQVIALVGNHEAMNVTGDLRYVSAGEYAAFTDRSSAQRRENVYAANKEAIEEAYRARDPEMTDDAIKEAWLETVPLGLVEHQAAWRPEGEIGRWVVENPAAIVIDNNLFVHGGISPAYAGLTIEEINNRVRDALTERSSASGGILNDPLGPLWYRGLVEEAVGVSAEAPLEQATGASAEISAATAVIEPPVEVQLENLLSAYGAERIVIGHTPILSGIDMRYGGRLILIDTGISADYGGTVSYLEILDGDPISRVIERHNVGQ